MTHRVIFLALLLVVGALALNARAAHALPSCPPKPPNGQPVSIVKTCEMQQSYSSPVTIGNNGVVLDCKFRSIRNGCRAHIDV